MGNVKIHLNEYGEVLGLPFPFPFTLADFDTKEELEDAVRIWEEEFEQTSRELRSGEPNPFFYEGRWENERYKSDMRVYELSEAIKGIQPKPQPPDPKAMPLDYRVMLEGGEKDKEEMRERWSLAKMIAEQTEKADRFWKTGEDSRAREAQDRASHLTRELEKMEREYEYSFLKAEREDNLKWGEEQAEMMMKTDPEWIKANRPFVESILQGWRDQSDAEFSYLVDDGSPRSRREGTGQIGSFDGAD